MRKTKKRFITLFISGIFVMTGNIYPLVVNAAEPETGGEALEREWNWTFGYTGTEQVFTAPYSGIYQFELYGAQGGNSRSKEGGKGGKITAAVTLSRNEEITICVGGQDGYNGGGAGTISAGGGATDIRRGGKEPEDRILVAGGGGGANNIYSGGNGGETESTISSPENGETSTEGSGGGGGYHGGSAGIEHIVSHTHSGYGGNCYVPDYHSHIGNESVYGGCYTIEQTKTMNVGHSWHVTGRGDTINWSGEIVEGEGETQYISTTYPVQDEHGHTGEITWCSHASGARADMKNGWSFQNGYEYGDAGGKLAEEPLNFNFTTSKDTSVTYYDLGCGLTTSSVIGYHLNCSKVYDEYEVKQAAGGTNYYDADACTAISESGVRAGDGECSIRLLTLYNLYYDGVESLNVYYDGIKVKKVYYKGKLIYRE